MKDLNLTITRALPTADGTVTSSDLDLGTSAPGSSVRDSELFIEVPALSAVNLPAADTLTITVQTGESAAPTTTANLVKVITGTGTAIAAQEVKWHLPSTIGRYVNVKVVAAGGTGDMSGVTATISLRPRLLK
jgi:hypothetical protein